MEMMKPYRKYVEELGGLKIGDYIIKTYHARESNYFGIVYIGVVDKLFKGNFSCYFAEVRALYSNKVYVERIRDLQKLEYYYKSNTKDYLKEKFRCTKYYKEIDGFSFGDYVTLIKSEYTTGIKFKIIELANCKDKNLALICEASKPSVITVVKLDKLIHYEKYLERNKNLIVGDTVRHTKNKTVGKITNIIEIDGERLAEVTLLNDDASINKVKYWLHNLVLKYE